MTDSNNDIWESGCWESPVEMAERCNRSLEQLEAFKQIALAITSTRSDDEVMKVICSQISQIMRAERTTLFIVKIVKRGDKDELWLENSMSQGTDNTIRLRPGQGIAGYVAEQKRILNVKDAYQDPHFNEIFDHTTGFRTKSCICAPILNRDEIIGVVEVLNKFKGYFTLDDEELLSSICSQIGVSIAQFKTYRELQFKNADLLQATSELQQKNDEVRMLYDIERDAAESNDLSIFINKMLPKCVRTFHAQYASIVLKDKSGVQIYEVTRSCDVVSEMKLRQTEKIPAYMKQILEKSQTTLITSCDYEDIRNCSKLELGVELSSILGIGLRQVDAELGAFILGRNEARCTAFSPDDGHLITIIASSLSSVIAAHIEREADAQRQRLSTIGSMMSSLMHDMKTPLANISGYTELLASDCLTTEKREMCAETVERNIERIKQMSSEILQFARGETTIVIQPTSMHTLLEHAEELVRNEVEKRGTTLKFEEHYDGKIDCDEQKILRVIVNLVKNALEALDKGGTIIFNTYDDQEHIYLRIEDDGPGIPSQIRDTLFDAFVTHGKKGGTGLGLAIVKKVIDEHKATITCVPIEPHGTAFIIVFNK